MKKTEPALWGADRKVCNDAAHPSDFPAVGDFVMAGWSLIHRECVNLACGMQKSGIDRTFSDIKELELQCRFRDCTHTVEPGCAVQKALKNGTLSKERMQSYQKLKTENDYMEHAKSYLEVAVKNMK